MTDEDIIDDLIRREGSAYTEHPHDRGGATKYGITQRAWEDYWAWQSDFELPAEVRDITEQHARDFYRAVHVRPFSWIKHDALRALAVDCAVNHGPTRTVQWLQEVARVAVDGRVGPVTRAAVNTQASKVFGRLLTHRFKFYAKIATDQIDRHKPQDPDALFLRGWINRACEFIE